MVKRRSKAEWTEICEDFESSKESVAAFTRRRRVPRGTLYGWVRRLREEGLLSSRSTKGFVEVVKKPTSEAGRVTVRFGKIAVEFVDGAPPPSWVAELLTRC